MGLGRNLRAVAGDLESKGLASSSVPPDSQVSGVKKLIQPYPRRLKKTKGQIRTDVNSPQTLPSSEWPAQSSRLKEKGPKVAFGTLCLTCKSLHQVSLCQMRQFKSTDPGTVS